VAKVWAGSLAVPVFLTFLNRLRQGDIQSSIRPGHHQTSACIIPIALKLEKSSEFYWTNKKVLQILFPVVVTYSQLMVVTSGVARWPVFHRPGWYFIANLAEAGRRPVF